MSEKEHITHFQLLLVGLSIYVLCALCAENTFSLSASTRTILELSDSLICLVFLADFVARFCRAEHKVSFLKWGWVDLLSSIPSFHLLRWGRLVRLMRVVRVLRAFRSIRVLLQFFSQHRAKSAATSVAFASVLLIVFSSIAILHFENAAESNIKTAEDALWWSVATVTTVGYGDRFPVTTEGRILGVILMTTGVGLFGVFTAYIATWFMTPSTTPTQEGTASLAALRDEVAETRREIGVLRTDLERMLQLRR